MRKLLAAAAMLLGAWAAPVQAQDGEPIKVGILHSLSGTMAISETTLKDVMLMLVERQNEMGGVLGRPLVAVVVDPASDWPLFAEKMRELVEVEGVDVIFCCWTSVSRKSILPVAEELNIPVFYPVQYEGEESQRNIFYTGAAPNQQAIPAVDYLLEQGIERWVLEGTDYVYPRTTNKILEAYLLSKGFAAEDIIHQLHAFRAFRLADPIELRHQGLRLARARRLRWSRPSTATPTCPSTRNSPTRASMAEPISRWWPSRWVRKSWPVSTPSRLSAISRPGTTSCRSIPTSNAEFIEDWHAYHRR